MGEVLSFRKPPAAKAWRVELINSLLPGQHLVGLQLVGGDYDILGSFPTPKEAREAAAEYARQHGDIPVMDFTLAPSGDAA